MTKMKTTVSMLFFGGFLFSQQPSQTAQVEEVILQGNRLQIPFQSSNRDIQILSSKDIAQFPVKSVTELLSYIGGVDVRQRGGFSGQADVSIDGGSSEEVLVLLDGVKLINSQTSHNVMNLPVTLGAIERIEVLRGAAARVYGINALTGAINIVTKNSKKSFFLADVFSGSGFQKQDSEEGSGIYAGAGLELTGNLAAENHRHLFSAGQVVSNGVRYNSAVKNSKLFYKGNFDVDANNQISALGGYMYNRFGANGFYAAPGDRNSEEIVETSVFGISSQHKIGNFTLMPRLSNRYDEDDYRYFKDNLSRARSMHYTNAFMAELNANLSTSIGEFGLGWESRFEKINSSNIGEHSRDNHGVFAEYSGSFGEKFRSTVGVYANYNSNFGWQVYPGIDASYLLSSKWQVSANIGSGQRIPSYTDLYLNQLPGNLGNPEVKPENSWQYELKVNYTQERFSFQTGLFYRNISEFIDWVRTANNQPYSPVNFGSNQVFGWYSRVSGTLFETDNQALKYRLNYNYLNPKITDNQNVQSKYVLENLKHQFIAGLRYSIENFAFSLENRLIKREKNNSYNLLDAKLSYGIGKSQVYLDVNNIFNEKYQETGAVPTFPRWINLGFRYYLEKN